MQNPNPSTALNTKCACQAGQETCLGHQHMDIVWTLAKVVLGLEVIVLFHLFGHWLAASLFRVPVEIRLGLGPAIPGCRFSRGRNRYILAVFPLFGYAKV